MNKPSKYTMPNAPRADLRATGKHLNPYYYPIDREPVPVLNSPISDPTEIPSSSEKTPDQLLAPVDRRKRSFLHTDILKEAASHLRRLQSRQLNPGNLED